MAIILRGDETAQEMADLLYEAAMAAGGYDNITAVVVHFA
jgi:serine/threonine protein phosphatase PrpC